jgi:hypothetical protein
MATSRLRGLIEEHLLRQPDASPVAFLWGLPMTLDEALAFQAWEAGVHTEDQMATLKAWMVLMTLKHGTWVGDQMRTI